MWDPASAPVMAARGLEPVPQDGPAIRGRLPKDRERWACVAKQGNVGVE